MAIPPNPKLSHIFGRRSIRKYEATPVSDALVADLLAAAMAAPLACAKDHWRFVVVRERATLAAMASAVGRQNKRHFESLHRDAKCPNEDYGAFKRLRPPIPRPAARLLGCAAGPV
jgi:nitroreductase